MSASTTEEQTRLACPDCGGVEFDMISASVADAQAEEPSADCRLECVECGTELTYGALVLANSEAVNSEMATLSAEFAKQLTDKLEIETKKLGF